MNAARLLEGMAGGLADLLYPPQCIACRAPCETPHGLCPDCWKEAGFISGPVCDACGAPVLNAPDRAGSIRCEDCTRHPPAWDRGRSALLYEGAARRLVLGLKHGDRLDVVRPLSGWMARAGAEVLEEADLLAPVPLHWLRFLKRRYNQSAELSRALARRTGLEHCPDLLIRRRATGSQEGRSRAERHAALAGAFALGRGRSAAGRRVLLVDDVMTTGATLSAAAETLRAAGAASVHVLVAARATRDRPA